jgi:hypothetical protein
MKIVCISSMQSLGYSPILKKTLVLLAWQEEQAGALGKEEEILYILVSRPIQ